MFPFSRWESAQPAGRFENVVVLDVNIIPSEKDPSQFDFVNSSPAALFPAAPFPLPCKSLQKNVRRPGDLPEAGAFFPEIS